MDRVHGSRLLALAADLLEKHPDERSIELTANNLSASEQAEKKREISDAELADFVRLLGDRDRKDIRYILTLDMGCGSCSIAIYDASDKLFEGLIPLDTGELDKNKNPIKDISIRTIIGYNDPDHYQIGSNALYETCAAKMNFKEMPRPSYTPGIKDSLQYPVLRYEDDNFDKHEHTLEKVWGDYLEKIVEKAQEAPKDPALDPEKNVVLVVAHPSGKEWARADVLALYKDMIYRHTKVPRHRVLTFSEAKAAMQYYRFRNTDNVMALDFKKGVLLVDLGASTIDVVYLSSETRDPIEFSITMAGRNVDRILGNHILRQKHANALAKLPLDELPDDGFFVAHKNMYGTSQQFEFFSQITKEAISGLIMQGIAVNQAVEFHNRVDKTETAYFISPGDLVGLLDKTPTRADYTADLANFYHAGQGQGLTVWQSWYAHFTTLLTFAMKELSDRKLGLGYVLVTGGSSNLPGIQDKIQAALDASKYQRQKISIQMFTNPADYERCVPEGSCRYVERVWNNLDRMKAFEKGLKNTIYSDLKGTHPVDDDTEVSNHDPIDQSITDSVIARFQNGLDAWAEGNDDDTLENLKSYVRAQMVDIPLDNLIQYGVNKMQEDYETIMKGTLAKADQLLSDMADTQYSAQIPIRLDQLNLDTGELLKNLDTYIGNINLPNYMSFFAIIKNLLALFFGGDGIDEFTLLDRKTRSRIADQLLDRSTPGGATRRADIKKAISGLVDKAIESDCNKESDGSIQGIVDRVVEDMSGDIKTALYLV